MLVSGMVGPDGSYRTGYPAGVQGVDRFSTERMQPSWRTRSPWSFHFVHAIVREPHELEVFTSEGVTCHPFHELLSDLSCRDGRSIFPDRPVATSPRLLVTTNPMNQERLCPYALQRIAPDRGITR